MKRSEVYSWRLSRDLKEALEEAARNARLSLSALLERAARAWLGREAARPDDRAQARLHVKARRSIGSLSGGDPRRSERARERLRAKLARRRAG